MSDQMFEDGQQDYLREEPKPFGDAMSPDEVKRYIKAKKKDGKGNATIITGLITAGLEKGKATSAVQEFKDNTYVDTIAKQIGEAMYIMERVMQDVGQLGWRDQEQALREAYDEMGEALTSITDMV